MAPNNSVFLVIFACPVVLLLYSAYGEKLWLKYVPRKLSDGLATMSAVLSVALLVLAPYRPALQETSNTERMMGMPILFWMFMSLVLATGGLIIYAGMVRKSWRWFLAVILCVAGMWHFAWPSLERLLPSPQPPSTVRMVRYAPKQGAIICMASDTPLSYGRVYLPRLKFAPEFEAEAARQNLVLVDIWPGDWFGCDTSEYAFDFKPNDLSRKRISDIPRR